MIQLLDRFEMGVGDVGGSGASSPMMPPESPVNSKQERQCRRRHTASAECEDAVVAVGLAHHAVAETIRGGGELYRHVRRLPEAVEAAALVEDLRDDSLLGDALDEIVQDHPLVVPRHDPARFREDHVRRACRLTRAGRRPCCGTSASPGASARRRGFRHCDGRQSARTLRDCVAGRCGDSR